MGISLTLNMYKVTTTFVNNQNHVWCKLIIVDNNTKMSYDPKENIRLTESDDYTEALKNHLKIYKEQITNDIEITEINLIEGNNIICKVKPQTEINLIEGNNIICKVKPQIKELDKNLNNSLENQLN